MTTLGEQTSTADKILIFNTLRKQDAITALSTGTAQLYFTPADVDLSIETRQSVASGASVQASSG